jgi:hypothetical protein
MATAAAASCEKEAGSSCVVGALCSGKEVGYVYCIRRGHCKRCQNMRIRHGQKL